MKIVVNRCFGGFSLSAAVAAELGITDPSRLKYGFRPDPQDFGLDPTLWSDGVEVRSAPRLIEAIEKVGIKEAAGEYASLEIVEVPDDATTVYIRDYDGRETVVWSMSEIHHI